MTITRGSTIFSATLTLLGMLALTWPTLADHVTVNPQPGFDAAEGDRLAHTDSDKPEVISSQLRIGTAWVRLGLQRIANGQVADGPQGWLEPATVGYHIITAAHHGIDYRRSKFRSSDPMLDWESKTINEARQHLRNGIERIEHTRAGEPGAFQYVTRELNRGLALVQRVQTIYP